MIQAGSAAPANYDTGVRGSGGDFMSRPSPGFRADCLVAICRNERCHGIEPRIARQRGECQLSRGATGQAGPRPPRFSGIRSDNTCVVLNGTTGRVQVPIMRLRFRAPDRTPSRCGSIRFNAAIRGDLFTYKGAAGRFRHSCRSQAANTLSVIIMPSLHCGKPPQRTVGTIWWSRGTPTVW